MKKRTLKSGFFLFALFLLSFEPLMAVVETQYPPANAPQALTVSVSNNRYFGFRISWSAHPDATKYRLWVQMDLAWDAGWESLPGFDGKEFGMTVLYSDVNFNSGNSIWSGDRKVIVRAYRNESLLEEKILYFAQLRIPITYSLTNVGNNGMRVSWNFDASYIYTLYVYKGEGTALSAVTGFPKTLIRIQDDESYQYDITGLNQGTPYTFAIMTTLLDGTLYNDTVHKIRYTPPLVPQALAATYIKANSFVANWKTTPTAPQYKIFVKNSSTEKYVLRGLVLNGVLSYKMDNLEPGTQYEYQVSSLNPLGESELSGVIKLTTTSLPVPVAISASSIGGTYFQARWNTLPNATGYLLQVSDGEVWSNYTIPSGTTNSYLVTGMKPDFTYEYRIRAYFGEDYTSYSNVITLKTLNSPVARAVTHREDPTSVILVWDPAKEATGYRLYVISKEGAANNPAGYFPKVLGTGLNHLMTGLKTGHAYQFYLDAIIPSGYTTISNKFDFNTPPATPVCLEPADITATSFKARWQVFDDVDETYLAVYDSKYGNPITGYNQILVTGTSKTVTGLIFNTGYKYHVRVKKNGLFNFGWSDLMNVKTDYVELKLKANPPNGGTVSGDEGWIKQYSHISVDATPAKGYQFVNWTDGVRIVSDAPNLSTTINADLTLTANFQSTSGVNDQKANLISIYPVPATDFISVSGITAKTEVKIYDTTGLNVLNTTIEKNDVINIASIQKGLYFIVFDNGQHEISGKIIKK